MLKRKLYQACLIVCSLISTALASGSRTILTKPVVDSSILLFDPVNHQFDSSGLCTCIPLAVKDELVNTLRIKLNKNVAGFVKEYNKKNGFFLGKTKKRTAPYFAIIDSVFEQEGIPVELKYLAFIESGLKRNVASRSGAAGPWAFMPVAAKEYGLKMSKQKDERLDYYKSSAAAAALLTDLYDKYGDWLMVLAAYNCGPGYMQKAIKRSGSRNYWTLQNFLPYETRQHVKKFIAVHYYFEGHGSLVTMSKEETAGHIKDVEIFISKKQLMEESDSLSRVL